MAEKKILIICGEASGELHAANLTSALKKIDPQLKIFGVGGQLLREAGAEIIHDIKGLSVIGLFDALKKLPRFFELKKFLLDQIKQNKFNAVIFVDFSGFNLRLAKDLNNSVPTIYYISPQVWASRPGRIRTIKKYIRKMIVLFKFEQEFYKEHGMDVDFVGHPLLDIVKPTMPKDGFLSHLKFSRDTTTIALLPGSRKQEISHILPIMLESARLIKETIDAQFVIAKSPSVDWEVYNRIIDRFKIRVKVAEGLTYDCLNIADFALVCSGTATLETAIMRRPFCVVYKMGLLNYLLYRPQVRLPYIGIVNIVAGRKIAREFIQFKADPKKIANDALRIIHDPLNIRKAAINLNQLASSLGEPGATLRAAKIISDFIS
jgi:lipid-A-disaccharide synthase